MGWAHPHLELGRAVALTPAVPLPHFELSGKLREKARGPGAQASAGARPGKNRGQPGGWLCWRPSQERTAAALPWAGGGPSRRAGLEPP